MEYRNSGAATHLGKGFVAGVDGDVGIELQGSTIICASDTTASNISLVAKSTGTVFIGNSSNTVMLAGSTTPFKLVVGESTTTVPNMPANSLQNSTFAAAGISTGDLILMVDARGILSTEVGMAGYTCTAANEINVRWVNPHASSITAETTGVVMRWAYLDRT